MFEREGTGDDPGEEGDGAGGAGFVEAGFFAEEGFEYFGGGSCGAGCECVVGGCEEVFCCGCGGCGEGGEGGWWVACVGVVGWCV